MVLEIPIQTFDHPHPRFVKRIQHNPNLEAKVLNSNLILMNIVAYRKRTEHRRKAGTSRRFQLLKTEENSMYRCLTKGLLRADTQLKIINF